MPAGGSKREVEVVTLPVVGGGDGGCVAQPRDSAHTYDVTQPPPGGEVGGEKKNAHELAPLGFDPRTYGL